MHYSWANKNTRFLLRRNDKTLKGRNDKQPYPLPPFMKYHNEIERRKTFAIISHPDAGKTTLTEKFLLFGGTIQVAGAVKSNKIKKFATSDFMEIERQRGISVACVVREEDNEKS
jgi:hypothetical protein